MTRSDFRGLRVLLVNNELFIRRLAERLLGALGIKEIVVAADCPEACDLLNAQTGFFDLALIDVEIPKVDGFRLINTIRQGRAGTQADLPVIILTGHGQNRARAQAGRMGANAVLVKPMTRDDLEESLMKVLGFDKT